MLDDKTSAHARSQVCVSHLNNLKEQFAFHYLVRYSCLVTQPAGVCAIYSVLTIMSLQKTNPCLTYTYYCYNVLSESSLILVISSEM